MRGCFFVLFLKEKDQKNFTRGSFKPLTELLCYTVAAIQLERKGPKELYTWDLSTADGNAVLHGSCSEKASNKIIKRDSKRYPFNL